MSNRNRNPRQRHLLRETPPSGVHSSAGVFDDSAEARIGRNIMPMPNGCWAWKGDLSDYATTQVAGSIVRVHRFVYDTLVGPIPDGYHLHHECMNKGCANPEHLRPLSPADHAAEHARLRQAS